MVNKIVYWTSTVVVAVMLLSALSYLTGNPQVVSGFNKVGYPQHLRIILGIAKPVAAIVLLLPGLTLVKEWAYLGAAFAWEAKDRYPTPAELKCMVYLSLIHGADGIGYYSYNYVSGKKGTNVAREQPELWQEVKQINSEIAEIRTLLWEEREVSVALQEGTPEIEFRALRGLDRT